MNAPATAYMRAVTHFGDGLTVALIGLVLGIGLLVRRRYWEVVSLVLAVGVGYAAMWGLKAIFVRDRPGDRLAEVLGHSFPSGHSFAAMTLYGFMIYLTWRYLRHDAVRIGVTIALILLILQVGLSRILLRVHWVSDVAGGFAVGVAWLVFSLVLTRALRAFLSDRLPVHVETGPAADDF
jgi:undecaprenyl-diphosphatase